MKIYVGNLPWSIDESALSQLFESYGEVTSANIITDRETGRSRGFGFIEMHDDEQARGAIAGLAEHQVDGRALNVNEAKPRPDRGGGGGGGGRSGGGGGRGGYGGGGGGGGRGGDRGGDRW